VQQKGRASRPALDRPLRANWRIIFRFQDGDAWDVELTDYH